MLLYGLAIFISAYLLFLLEAASVYIYYVFLVRDNTLSLTLKYYIPLWKHYTQLT